MATIENPTLLFVTSPRSPFKMRPEIKLLVTEFGGKRWNRNRELQASFAKKLSLLPEFKGAINPNNPTFSARDRITRGPKALGLVNLDSIGLTPAGERFLNSGFPDEALLRQLLKYQLPSPFHNVSPRIAKKFCIRPYLEIIRLIYSLGRLAFDELCLFGMQLTDWHDFDLISEKIRSFRIDKVAAKGQYKKFLHSSRSKVVAEIFAGEIAAGRIRTRESAQVSLDKFIKTKAGNLRDYADACLRYLRGTGLVTISNPGRTISIVESRRDEVSFILDNIDRNPVFISDEEDYCKHLYDADSPPLLTDDRKTLEIKAIKYAAVDSVQTADSISTQELKARIECAKKAMRASIVEAQTAELKSYSRYDEVVALYGAIRTKDVYDPSLAFEWNVWRTMTMLDGGKVHANLVFDDAGNPLSTAPGNGADIVCDYGDFILTVEVTLMSGNKQYDAEAEPVARHLGDIKAKTGKPAYCFFISPKINASTISYFYMLHRTNVRHYGGKSVVIPLALDRFVNMLEQSKNSGYVPEPGKVKNFCEYSKSVAESAADEEEWYALVSAKADNWLSL